MWKLKLVYYKTRILKKCYFRIINLIVDRKIIFLLKFYFDKAAKHTFYNCTQNVENNFLHRNKLRQDDFTKTVATKCRRSTRRFRCGFFSAIDISARYRFGVRNILTKKIFFSNIRICSWKYIILKMLYLSKNNIVWLK